MGSIMNLSSEDYQTHLLFTNSNLAELYVYDSLKEVCEATVESVYNITNKKTFNEMLELSNMHPYLSRLWLFVVDYHKTKASCKQFKAVFQSNTAKFLIKVQNYGEYKEVKSLIGTINDMYLVRISSDDVMKLLKGYDISQKTLDFIAKTYSNDVEKIFELKNKLDSGLEVTNPKSVITLVGASGGTINRYVMQLLADPPTTEKGFKMVYRNRVKDAKLLLDAYGITSFRNFLVASTKDIMNIKVLYNQGIIFKQIRDLPEVVDEQGNAVYDEKRLSKYTYFLERITTEIPYTRIVRLYTLLKSSYWRTEEDVLKFLYDYYGGLD